LFIDIAKYHHYLIPCNRTFDEDGLELIKCCCSANSTQTVAICSTRFYLVKNSQLLLNSGFNQRSLFLWHSVWLMGSNLLTGPIIPAIRIYL